MLHTELRIPRWVCLGESPHKDHLGGVVGMLTRQLGKSQCRSVRKPESDAVTDPKDNSTDEIPGKEF